MSSLTVVTDGISSSGYCPCVVCFKNVFRHNQNLQEPNSKLLHLFNSLLQRMSLSPASIPKEYGLCNDCAVIVEPVTNLFYQIQCLQLKLDWNLRRVVKIMVFADMVPSRMNVFQEMYKGDRTTTDDIKQFRCALKNKLKGRKAGIVPKVVLRDCAKTATSSDNNFSTMSFKVIQMEPSVFKTDDDEEQLDDKRLAELQPKKMKTTDFSFGLGWIVSFITVASLYSPSAEGGAFGVSLTGTSELESDLRNDVEISNDQDEYCDMKMVETVETPAETEQLLTSSVIPLESISDQREKLNVTLPNPMTPVTTGANVLDSRENERNTNASNEPGDRISDSNSSQMFESGRRLLRRQYKCTSCRMIFSTAVRLDAHRKWCDSKNEQIDTGTESDEEINIHKNDPWQNTKMNESESSSDDEFSTSLLPSDGEGDTKVAIHEIKSLEVNKAFKCSLCKKSYPMDDLEYEKFMQLHNHHMHSKGQTLLDQSTIGLLQITAADVKLDSTKFSIKRCSFPECKTSVFADNDSFEYHKSLHGVFKCGVCDFECSFAIQLAIHETDHSSKAHNTTSYPCPRCPFKANVDYKYYNHFLETHLNLNTQQAQCGVCKTTFLDLTVPLQHFVNEHDLSRIEHVSNVSRCFDVGCGAYFLKISQLEDHAIVHQKEKHELAKIITSGSRLAHKCDKCSKRFLKLFQLTAHRSIFHTKNGNRIIFPNGLTIDDVIYKTKGTYYCPLKKCPEKFMTKAEIKTHAKLHGKFPCQFCPEVFKIATKLSLHEKKHSLLKSCEAKEANKRYNCARCNYQTGKLNRYVYHHMDTHLGVVPDQIKCPICQYSFQDSRNYRVKKALIKHMIWSHDSASLGPGQCFVKCDICNPHFVTGVQLNFHKSKVHQLELKEKEISTNKLKHMCSTCKKCFHSETYLKNHQRAAHVHLKKERVRRPVYKCRKCLIIIKMSNVNTYKRYNVQNTHKRYKHSNGQSKLLKSTVRHLNLTADNIQLAEVFKKQCCPEQECSRKIFLNDATLKFHYSLHGDFACNVCDFKCNFATKLISHELEHSTSSTKGQNSGSVTCSRCEIDSADHVRHFLEKHLNIDTTERSKCDICQAWFEEVEVPFHHYVNEHDLNRLDDLNKVFKCVEDTDNCRAYFLTDSQLQEHNHRIHKGVQKKPTSQLDLKLHQAKTHTGVKRTNTQVHSCDQCQKQFIHKKSLLLHQIKTHTNLDSFGHQKITSDGMTINDLVNKKNATHFCSVGRCDGKFFYQEDLTAHSKLHGTFSCIKCREEKTFALELAIHETSHSSNSNPSGKREYNCIRCDFKTCVKRWFVKHHLETHLDLLVDVTRCPICRKCIRGHGQHLKTRLFNHYRSMHDLATLESGAVAPKCDFCPAYFLNEIQLSTHINNEHGQSKNINKTCMDCGKTFKKHFELINHRKNIHLVNDNEFQFICGVKDCKEKFEFKIGLEGHIINIHNQDYGKFKCPKCAQQFKRKSLFEKHVRNHEETTTTSKQKKAPQPVICEQCGKIFKTKCHLKRHKLRHVGPDGWEFVCEICSRKFGVKANLEQHKRTHTKEKPFVCEVCGEKYAHKHNWKSHMNSKHNAKLPTRQVNTANMKSTRKGKKLPKYAPISDSSKSESD